MKRFTLALLGLFLIAGAVTASPSADAARSFNKRFYAYVLAPPAPAKMAAAAVLPPTEGAGTPITRAEFERRGALPAEPDPMAGVSNLDALSMERWGNRYASKGFMHISDHESAWAVVHPGIAPSWFDLHDSHNAGEGLIIAAARISFSRTGPDPGWSAAELRMALLVQMHGIGNGLAIADGRRPDPNKGAPLEAVKDGGVWIVRLVPGGVAPPPVVAPPDPGQPPVVAPPTPPVAACPPSPAPPAAVMDTATKAPDWLRIGRPRKALLAAWRDWTFAVALWRAQCWPGISSTGRLEMTLRERTAP